MRCVNLVQTTCMHDASTNGHDDHMHDGPPRKLVSIMFIVFFQLIHGYSAVYVWEGSH